MNTFYKNIIFYLKIEEGSFMAFLLILNIQKNVTKNNL
jgi:hypothetical protein